MRRIRQVMRPDGNQGYIVDPWLLPRIETTWDVDGLVASINLVADELLLADPSDTAIVDTRLILPEITESGVICGFKNVAAVNPSKAVTIEPFMITDTIIGLPGLMSGSNLLISAILGAGTCLVFLSHVDPEPPNDRYWVLTSYLQGV